MKKMPREQKPKTRVERVQGLRMSNASGTHRTPKNYTRKVKHKGGRYL